MGTYYQQMGLEEGEGIRKELQSSNAESNEQKTKFIQIGNEVLELLEVKAGLIYKVINLITLKNDKIISVRDINYPVKSDSFQNCARSYLKQPDGFTRTVYMKKKVVEFIQLSLDEQFNNIKPNW